MLLYTCTNPSFENYISSRLVLGIKLQNRYKVLLTI